MPPRKNTAVRFSAAELDALQDVADRLAPTQPTMSHVVRSIVRWALAMDAGRCCCPQCGHPLDVPDLVFAPAPTAPQLKQDS